MNSDIFARILMFAVGVIILAGSIKFVMLSFNGQRGVVQGIAFGAVGSLVGSALCVWAIVGTPD